MSSKLLLKKSLIYGIGTFGSKVLIFLLVPIYSYFVSKDGFGYYDLINSTMNLLIPFITFQISDSLFRWLLVKKDDFFYAQKVITNSFFPLLLGISSVILVSFILYYIKPIKYQLLITLMFIVAMIYPFLQQITRGLGYTKLFAVNGIIYSFVYLISNIIFIILLKQGVEGIFISSIFAFLIASLLIIFRINFFSYINFKLISKIEMIGLIRYSLPLVPNTISWWLINSANKYIILYFLGISANGLFAMSNRFPIILVMINQIFTLAWHEQAIIDYEKKDAKVNGDILKGLIKTQFTIVIILSLISQLLVENLLSKEYYMSWKYMPILYLCTAFNSLSAYYGAFYLGAKKTKIIFTTTIYGGLITIFLGILLVKPLGLIGISIATLIGYISLYLIRKIRIKNITQIEPANRTLVIYGSLVILSFIATYLENAIINLITLLVISIFILNDNKNILKNLITKINIKK